MVRRFLRWVCNFCSMLACVEAELVLALKVMESTVIWSAIFEIVELTVIVLPVPVTPVMKMG